MTQPPAQADTSRSEIIRLQRPGAPRRPTRRWPFLRRILAFRGLEAIVAILLWKAMTFGVIYLAWHIFPFNFGLYDQNLRYGPPSPTEFRYAFHTWDTQHFLRIADFGYEPDLLTNAFGPLYPMLIRFLGLVTGDLLIAGLIISNVASAVGLYLFYELVRVRWNRDIAFTALLLFLAFPTSFFMNLIYTEALFVLLLVLVFQGLYQRNYPLAAVAAFFLPMLRVPGLVALVPMAWALVGACFGEIRTIRRGIQLPRLSSFRWHPRLLYLLAPLTGFAVYLLFMQIVLGNPFVAMETEKMYISDRGLHNLLEPWHVVEDFFGEGLYAHGYVNSKLDRAFFVAFLLCIPLVYRAVDKPMFLFCVIIGLQPFLGSYMSYTRLVMVAFPLYIAWATMLTGRRQRIALALLVPLATLQGLMLSLHATGQWAA